MTRLLLLLLALLIAALPSPAAAQLGPARANAISPELVAEGPARPGGEVELAILMRTRPGWHGYWLNPGDAGQPMRVDWRLPPGARLGPLRYPVPGRLTIAGLMNYVYERDHAVLTRLHVPADATGPVPLRASLEWLACTDKICVPEKGSVALDLATGGQAAGDERFDEWRRALPRPLAAPARFATVGDRLRLAVPLPADVAIPEPYVFPATDKLIVYAAPQRFWRDGDRLVAELALRPGAGAERFEAVLALGDGRGLSLTARPGSVEPGRNPLGSLGSSAVLLALIGALAGGLLLNLMPCVFPILALKALALARAGATPGDARREALAYAAGAIIGTGLLGAALLALRAGGSSAGWAFQLQDPRTTLLLMLLAGAITLNLIGAFAVPALAGGHGAGPRGGFATGALAAFVATPCAGPFLGAALGTALLLPAGWSVAVFASLGLGLALPFLAIALVPRLRSLLPRPGRWMERLQRLLAIPMAATALACLWLLWRQGGGEALLIGIAALALLALLLLWLGHRQRSGSSAGPVALLAALAIAAGALAAVPRSAPLVANAPAGAEPWSEQRVGAHLAAGRPVFVYFTADWCLTCKVNEVTALDRDPVRAAFRRSGVRVLAGDWTNGEPRITRFLEARGRAGVPLYLWYEPDGTVDELPQILTPAMLVSRAERKRQLAGPAQGRR